MVVDLTDEQVSKVVEVIQQSELDQTIKDILIKDLHADGLTDFLSQQILAYCGVNVEKIIKE